MTKPAKLGNVRVKKSTQGDVAAAILFIRHDREGTATVNISKQVWEIIKFTP